MRRVSGVQCVTGITFYLYGNANLFDRGARRNARFMLDLADETPSASGLVERPY